MLDFVWHLRGSTALAGSCTNEAAMGAVRALLKKQRKPVVEVGPNSVTSSDPLWRKPFAITHPSMAIYDRGRFWIEQGHEGRRLCYKLRSLHGMVFCLFGAFMFFFFGLAGGGLTGGIKVAALAFVWLYGINILLALLRVPHSVRKAVRTQQ